MATAWLSPVFAANAATELDSMVVSTDWLGDTTAESVKTYPGSREVLTEEELHDRGALNLEDALRSVNGIQVLDETGTGNLPNIGIRGLNPLRSEQLQLLVDGYPIGIGPYTNVGGVLNLVTKPISRDFEQSISERITIAEDTGNAYYDSYYGASGFVTVDLGLQLQVNLQDGEGFRDDSETYYSGYEVLQRGQDEVSARDG